MEPFGEMGQPKPNSNVNENSDSGRNYVTLINS